MTKKIYRVWQAIRRHVGIKNKLEQWDSSTNTPEPTRDQSRQTMGSDKPSPSPFRTLYVGIPDPKANTATNDNTPTAETEQNEDPRKQIKKIMALNGSGDEWRTPTTDEVPVRPQEAGTDPPNMLGHGENIDNIIGGGN